MWSPGVSAGAAASDVPRGTLTIKRQKEWSWTKKHSFVSQSKQFADCDPSSMCHVYYYIPGKSPREIQPLNLHKVKNEQYESSIAVSPEKFLGTLDTSPPSTRLCLGEQIAFEKPRISNPSRHHRRPIG